MQDYREVQEEDTVRAAREIWNHCLKTLLSNFSGEAFPTENLSVGMKCYRTDEKKTYTLKEIDPPEWDVDGSGEMPPVTKETVQSVAFYAKTLMPSISDRVTDWSALFSGCRALETIDLRVLGYGADVTNISFLFCNCNSLLSILHLERKAFCISEPNFVVEANGTVTDNRAANKEKAKLTVAAYLLKGCESLPEANVGKLNVAKVAVFDEMFAGCRKLEAIDVSQWDVGEATSMRRMFAGCESLKTLDTSRWDVSKVKVFSELFKGCGNIVRLQLAAWDTSSATSTAQMFENCASLEALDLSSFDLRNVTTTSGMFRNCTADCGIKTGANTFNMPHCKDLSYMFAECSASPEMDTQGIPANELRRIVCTGAVDMSHMFDRYCGYTETYRDANGKRITGLTISLKTPNLLRTACMFQSVPHAYLDVKLDMGKVVDVSRMFWGAACKSIRLRDFDTSSVEVQEYDFPTWQSDGMKDLFRNCSKLEYLILDDAYYAGGGNPFRFKLLYDVLADLPATCKILVYPSRLDAYKTADYWKDHIGQIESMASYDIDGAVVSPKK
ncbi:BspA family leucine-rich repeat surface protein [uncultured Mitsuokella sp.]|uniref:BspA family leucine-rich repeat surface protein n=1 Tax=uncultured Mitsuokella sp. TaxID=453120 RepID=UPI00260F29C6|nr:BspA family leucine-rich repeat surface protein [uncultured Mitsuokella sp.]